MLKIESGLEKRPLKVVIYGAEGIGKSTFASQFPEPLFLDTEGGTSSLNIRRVKCGSSWEYLLSCVNEVIKDPSICKTLVIDTADWAESLCTKYVCEKYRKSNIEEFGFGKGYVYLQDEFSKLLTALDKLIELGVNAVVTAHGKPRKFELPEEAGQFDRWEMKLTKQVAPLLKEWCDMLLFCNYKTYVVTTENNTKKAQGGKRVVYTSHHACWDAKNRYGLPDELDLDFKGIAHLFGTQSPKKPPVSKENTESELLSKVKELIKNSGVSEAEVEDIVTAKGHYTKDQHLADYKEDFLARWIIPNFKKIVETINKTKSTGGNE
jgi:hypothetical protein